MKRKPLQKPKNPRPFGDLKRPNLWHVAKHLGFLNETDEAINSDVAMAVAVYRKCFVFSEHTGVYFRKPNKPTEDEILRGFPENSEEWRSLLSYQDNQFGIGHCRILRRKSQAYHAIRVEADGSGNTLGEDELAELDRNRPSKLTLFDLMLHFARGHNPLLLRYYHLETQASSRVPYFVLDIDDHSQPETHDPRDPSPLMSRTISELTGSVIFDPAHAVVFTSPSGRGRHLYYFLSNPLPAGFLHDRLVDYKGDLLIKRGMSAELQEDVADYEVFPRHGQAMPPLPLCRGSYLCDENGVPLPVMSTVKEELFRLQDLLQNRVSTLNVDVLRGTSASASFLSTATVPPSPSPAGISTKVHAAATAPPPRLSAGAGVYKDRTLVDWFQRGLLEQSTRQDGTLAVAHYCRLQGMSRSEAIATTTQWLHEMHNEQSDDYGNDRKKALKYVEIAVNTVYGKQKGTPYTLAPEDVATIAEALVSRARKAGAKYELGKQSARKLLFFTCQLAAFIRAHRVKSSGQKDNPTARVGIEVMRQFKFGSGTDYKRKCRILEKLGLMLHHGDSSWPHNRRAASITFRLALTSPSKEDVPVWEAVKTTFQKGGLGAQFKKNFFNDSAWSRFVNSPPKPMIVKSWLEKRSR